MKWKGIVKVQREIGPNPDSTVCIYSEDRSIYLIDKMDDKIRVWFKKDQLKFYAEAILIGTIIHLISKTSDQDW